MLQRLYLSDLTPQLPVCIAHRSVLSHNYETGGLVTLSQLNSTLFDQSLILVLFEQSQMHALYIL